MKRDLYKAYLHASYCAEALLINYTISIEGNRYSRLYGDAAQTALTNLANELGFDLVKRPAEPATEPAQEAA